jgi:acyl-CoA hydrolase
MAIGRNCADLVEDRATLQMGIGAIPNAVLASLKDHKNLGVHTEIFSDGLIDLLKSGVVNGKLKCVHPHKVISSFTMGTRRLYDFIDDNSQLSCLT